MPVAIGVETGGFDHRRQALLGMATVFLTMDASGEREPADRLAIAIDPHPGLIMGQSALDFTGIDPFDPAREAEPEREALTRIFDLVRKAMQEQRCTRAIMVAHNAHFDLGFVNRAAERSNLKRNPFHPFSCFDTATLAGLAFGQTVLARACQAAAIPYDNRAAHSAGYDADCTATMFCTSVNRWRELGGWVPATVADDPERAD